MSVRRRTWKDSAGKEREAWVVHVEFTHPDGRVEVIRKTSPVNTRRGAEDYERQVRNELLAGTYRAAEAAVPTLAEFEDAYLTASRNNNKPSTLKAKRDILRVHLLPTFGTTRLDRIDAESIEAFKAAARESGRSPKTVNNILTVLRNLLATARTYKRIEHIPEIRWMVCPEPDFDYLTFDEADRLVAAAEPAWRPMLIVALNTGLRLGELTALQWDCVDLVAGRLLVKRNLYRGVLGTPKGGRTREVPLNDRAARALQEHRHLKKWVFSDADGQFLNAYNACQNAIARNCRRAGLRPVGWHDLRHTFASHLVMRGVPLKAVQELLGHATMEMTMRYAHLCPDVRRDAVRALDQPRPAAREAAP